jgi:succinylglutamate desuccinylase
MAPGLNHDPMLTELDHLPADLLRYPAPQLASCLDGPTLIHLPGRHPAPLFVSVLLHGNETTGWDAIRQLLRHYQPGGGARPLPRALSLFIGNVRAASQGQRRLEGQPDFNRVWPGCRGPAAESSAEQRMMADIRDHMARRGVFASVDLHNNTGINPHYACINRIDHRSLQLATLFSRTVVYFTRPCGVQSMAMAELCPAVTLECGKAGQGLGVEHTLQFLEAVLHLSEHIEHPVAAHDIDLFHSIAQVRIVDDLDFGFGSRDRAIDFIEDLERLNFRELPAGTLLGRVRGPAPPLVVLNEQDQDVWHDFLRIHDDQLLTRRPLMPSMLTTDETAVRQDCLCYFMERYPSHRPPFAG